MNEEEKRKARRVRKNNKYIRLVTDDEKGSEE